MAKIVTLRAEWRPIAGYEGRYEVSSLGRVRSLPRKGVRELRILTGAVSGGGYHFVCLTGGRWRDQKAHQVHVLVATAFHGERPKGAEECRHLDGDRNNNRAENLSWGTRSENQYDSVRHGTHGQARKGWCSAGHEYTPDNTARSKTGSRVCRKCSARRSAEHRAKWMKKAAERRVAASTAEV